MLYEENCMEGELLISHEVALLAIASVSLFVALVGTLFVGMSVGVIVPVVRTQNKLKRAGNVSVLKTRLTSFQRTHPGIFLFVGLSCATSTVSAWYIALSLFITYFGD
jgi:hypothetical protein